MAKRLSATPLIDETSMDTNELSRVKTLVPVARIGSSLLLKTSLPRSPGYCKDVAGKLVLSIAGRNVSEQRFNRQAVARCAFLGSRRGRTGRKCGLVGTPETITAARRAEKQQGQQESSR